MRSTQQSTFAVLSALAAVANAGLVRRLPPAANPPAGWAYQGCYVDVGRTLAQAATTSGTMTAQACISFCISKGLQFAATEYHNECYCGSQLAPAANKVADSECSTSCSGDATQGCGGPSRLTVYHSSEPVGPQPNPGVNGFNHVGCYTEGTNVRALGTGGGVPAADVSASTCTAACLAKGFILAGVEYGGECYCGNTLGAGSVPASSGCSTLCNGNPNEICGGASRLNLYNYQNQFPISSSSSSGQASTTTGGAGSASESGTVTVAAAETVTSASATPTAPSQPANIGAYTWYGCQTEATGARALGALTRADDLMTLEMCASVCAGYTYFGVEYARECYCGNSFAAGSLAAPASECSFTCPGNQWQFCGAGNRLSVYSLNGPASSSSATGTNTGTATGVSTATSATTSAAVPTGMPDGFTYQGCWIDGPNGRALPDYQAPDSQTLTQESCAQLCNSRGFSVSGTEYSTQCFCSNAVYAGGAKTAESECNMPCSGNPAQKCGAGGRLTIYSKGVPQTFQPPAPQTAGLDNWAYQGCYIDNVNDKRTFFWKLEFPGTMTPKMCLDRCAKYGYAAAGLEYGQECYCGDPQNVITMGATKRPESECGVVCAGNATAICGGGSRLTTYFWTGTPLYSWTFPATPAAGAGKYDLLIDGVTIPLIAQEGINGKVAFLSKWGTGPGNETGAYELDISMIPTNPTGAWRTLHVKTDVFCAAGVTLPDRAGRMLNVGGWSGESTEGVRLFAPSGTNGVPGTTDWQENVNQLSLQKGRWYPSAMVMANGSVMVIGGQVGSNGAAVPSIEVLPFTGTAPVYMDWLDRTNPDNLYPFVAVLPQGGIFVAYYNEARILDESTFATTKELPMIPGAVNDDKSGRTYPLEGTAVLMPQKASNGYADFEVLICGGSANGISNALDNCVTIAPQAANPAWTMERMPSPRVMPCIAPLPDGTYFVGNGAKAGVAGFGLATNPNLNSLLYDPSKPVGSRFAVGANTTIARMYHSEAITLLDGRVLVSGSDPEDGVNPQEYRVEAYTPPYLLTGKPRPTFAIANKDWAWGQAGIPITLGAAAQNGGAGITATLLGSVSSTHGNSMGARTLMPAIRCTGTSCTIDAPPNAHVCPPGWYQLFILDGGVPAVGIYVRIGGDPAGLGNWPSGSTFTKPGVGPVQQ
ncbi:hypothetical protein RB595_000861 [Gaeumannomyces hyphopodioides]